MMSSNRSGFSLRSTSRMPLPSSWNTPRAVAAGQQFEGLLVVERQLGNVDPDRGR
jgi:hypothetical protein